MSIHLRREEALENDEIEERKNSTANEHKTHEMDVEKKTHKSQIKLKDCIKVKLLEFKPVKDGIEYL